MEARRIDFAAIPLTAIKVVTSPVEFFREMPKSGGFAAPFVFITAMQCVNFIIFVTAVLMIIKDPMLIGSLDIRLLWYTLLILIFIVVSGYFVAAILFVIWKFMGSNEDYETAYRCTAYLAAISPIYIVLTFIPYVGGLIGLVVMLYYLVTASVAVHGIPSQKAWLWFGIIWAFLMVIVVSAEIMKRRLDRNMEQANESWKDATEKMERATKEMQEQMQKELEQQKQENPSE